MTVLKLRMPGKRLYVTFFPKCLIQFLSRAACRADVMFIVLVLAAAKCCIPCVAVEGLEVNVYHIRYRCKGMLQREFHDMRHCTLQGAMLEE